MNWRNFVKDSLIALTTAVQVLICRGFYRRDSWLPPDDAPILVIRCEAKIGDNVLHIPFLRALRFAYPARQIHLLHHTASREIYLRCPYIDERIEIDWRMSAPRTLLHRLSLCAAVFRDHGLRQRYAFSLVPRWDEDLYGPFLAWMSGAPRVVGFSRRVLPKKAWRNIGMDLLLTDAICDTSVQHESQRALQLLERLPHARPGTSSELEFWFSDDDLARVAAVQADASASSCAWVAVAPGAALDRRKWPVDRFARVSEALAQLPGVRLMFLGAAADAADCEALLRACLPFTALNLAGRLSLSETAAALSTCRLFVGNDSGLLHVACAVGTRALEISCHPIGAGDLHANAPARFGPTVERSVVLRPLHPLSRSCRHGCEYDQAHCITAVPIDAAIQTAELLLDIPDVDRRGMLMLDSFFTDKEAPRA